MRLSALSITNNNAHVEVSENVEFPVAQLVMYEGADANRGVGIFYFEGDADVYVYSDQSEYLRAPEGDYEHCHKYVFNRPLRKIN